MFTVFNAKYCRIRAHHDRPYQPVAGGLPVSSMVIPFVNAYYVEEALLSPTFIARYAPDLADIVIVTYQSAAAFPALPAKTHVATLSNETRGGDYPYKQIFLSRLVKMQVLLQVRTDGILMIDSDLNLLSMPHIALHDDHLYSSFRRGKMIDRLSGLAPEAVPTYYRDAVRPKLVDHVNDTFTRRHSPDLAAHVPDMDRIFPRYLVAHGRFPAADRSAVADGDAGYAGHSHHQSGRMDELAGGETHWRHGLGHTTAGVGAHGGFPLSEWQQYLQSR